MVGLLFPASPAVSARGWCDVREAAKGVDFGVTERESRTISSTIVAYVRVAQRD